MGCKSKSLIVDMAENWETAIENLKVIIKLRKYTNIDLDELYFDPINNNYSTIDATNINGEPVLIIIYRSTSETKSKSAKPKDPNRIRKFNTDDMKFIGDVIATLNAEKGTERQTIYYADIILVSNRKGTNKKTPTLIRYSHYRESLWMFHVNELQIDISKHFLQPLEFEIVSPQEAKEYFLKRSIKPTQMNTISTHDPLGKWYGIKAGQLVRVRDKAHLNGLLVKDMITPMVVVDRRLPPRK